MRVIETELTGKPAVFYVAANSYSKGEPFTQPKRERAQAAPPVEEELCDFEIERQKNIARNQELLRQLGLA